MQAHPDTIGRFRIDCLLGRGAMGVVYKAHDPDIDRVVAVKLIRADLLAGEESEKYIRRFRNEARIAGKLAHPSIVSVFDVATQDGNPFIVMEYVEGLPLGKAFQRGAPAPAAEAVRIGLHVLDALDYAHKLDVVHRDVKPANLLLAAQGRIKITDFGISRLLSSDITIDPVMIGTPSYMSPEQCRGNAVDARSDLFSLGCVLYELLAGMRPFAGQSYTGTLHRLLHEPHQPLSALRPDLPPALPAVIDRVLAKAPGDRFASAVEMAAAIRDADSVSANLAPASVTPTTPDPGPDLARIDDTEMTRTTQALATILGPVARVLVNRARLRAASVMELHALCEEWVLQSEEKARFRQALDIETPTRKGG